MTHAPIPTLAIALVALLAMLSSDTSAADPQTATGPNRNTVAGTGDIRNISRRVPPNRLVILDYSGSMNRASAQPGYRLYELARETAVELLRTAGDIDSEARTGLVVFGHNIDRGYERESCEDVQVELPYRRYAAGDAARIEDLDTRLRRPELRPKGQTPLTRSIEVARRELRTGGAIILLTDLDWETCPPRTTPCEQITRLRGSLMKKNIFITHIVALAKSDLSALGSKRLAQCALGEHILITKPSDIGPAIAGINQALDEAAKWARAAVSILFQPAPFLLPPLAGRELDARLDVASTQGVVTAKLQGMTTTVELAPGEARIAARIEGQTVTGAPFTARRNQTARFSLRFQPVPVMVRLLDAEDNPLPADARVTWTVSGKGAEESVIAGPRHTFNLLAFPHVIEANVYDDVASIRYTPRVDGPANRLQINLGDVRLAGRQARVTTSVEMAPSILFAPRKSAVAIEFYDAARSRTFKLPVDRVDDPIDAGQYQVTMIYKGRRISLGNLEIGAGERVSIESKLPVTLLVAETNRASENTIWILKNEEEKELRLSGRKLVQHIPPGIYKLTAINENGRRSRDISIEFFEPQRRVFLSLN